MPWRSAEAVLFNLDEDAPPAYAFWIEPLNVGGAGRRWLGAAAIYRHQEQGGCDCSTCRVNATTARPAASLRARR